MKFVVYAQDFSGGARVTKFGRVNLCGSWTRAEV
jgi:hypothetical protein